MILEVDLSYEKIKRQSIQILAKHGINAVSETEQVSIVEVNREIATALLNLNTCNRKLKDSNLKMLERAVNNGDFLLTNQGIGLMKNLILADGQHRLMAIEKSGHPARMAVFTGLDNRVSQVVDNGAARSLADSINVSGITKHIDNAVVATIRRVSEASGVNLTKYSAMELVAAYDAYEDGVDFAIAELKTSSTKGVGSSGVLGAVASAYYFCKKEKLEHFCRVLKSGITENEEDKQVIRLRDWLVNGITTTGSGRIRETMIRTMKVISDHQKGADLKKTITPEDYIYKPKKWLNNEWNK